MIPRPPRRHPRRGQVGVHRAPAPAPETPAEVLERAPDVSRETSAKDAESAAWGALSTPDPAPVHLEPDPGPAPPLRREQILRLEALTAVWERQVRLEGPADATLVYSAPKPPPPAARPRLAAVPDAPGVPSPSSDPAVVAEADARELAAEAAEDRPAPTPSPVPRPGSARVSDWSSRHDPRSLDYGVRERLGRAVPLQDVSLFTGAPVLDQGTTPPLTVADASACVGMTMATLANVLAAKVGRSTFGRPLLDEGDALTLYRRAQDLDHVTGNTAGTSVLAGLKAGQEAGLWDGYLWALGGTRDIAQVLLQLGLAVAVGVPWSEALENPDAVGIAAPGGADLGGHALAVVGLRMAHAGRPGPWFELQQSRGPSEGRNGRIFLHHRHLAQLLAGIGEAGVAVREDAL